MLLVCPSPFPLPFGNQKFVSYICDSVLLLFFKGVWNLFIIPWHHKINSIQFSSVAQTCPTLCDPMNLSTPGLPVHHQLPELTQTHVNRVGDAIQPSHPLPSPSPPAPISPSNRVFSSESTLCMRWPKYWSFSFNISPSNEHPGLISFGMDWLDLLAVQGTLKGLLQHHDSRASIFRRSAFFTVQLSYPYMTTGKTIALTRQTFVGKVMSLLSNMLSRLVITFLPRSKCLLISWLQSPSAVILEPQKIVWHCFHCFPIYLPWSDGTRRHAHQTPTRAYCLQQTVQTIVHFAIERILNLFLKSLSALLPQLFPKLARIFCCTQIVFLLLIPLPRLHPKEEGSDVEIIAFNGEKDGWRVGSSPFILQPMLTTCQALFHT